MCNGTVRRVHVTVIAVQKKEILQFMSVSFLALGIQQAMRMRRIVLSCDLYSCTIYIHIIS